MKSHQNALTLFFSLLLVAFGVNGAAAQSAEQILKKAAQASGLDKNLKNARSWRWQGKIVRLSDGAIGNFQAEAQQPNLYCQSSQWENSPQTRCFNGKSAWSSDAASGLQTMTGKTANDFQAEAAFRAKRWLNYKDEKSIVAAGGKSVIDGKPVAIVVFTTVKNVRIKLYFEVVSGLLVREEIPAGEYVRVFDYSDFRTVDGVQEPFTVKMSEGEVKYIVRIQQIIHNAQTNRATFDFPAQANENLPDLRTFLEAVKTNQAKVDKSLENYSYTEEITDREFDKNGNLLVTKVETFEVTFLKGKQISRLVARNGQRLTAREQAKQDKAVQKDVEKLERANDIKGSEPSIAEILSASLLTNPRRENFKGRGVLVFDFEPDPNFKNAGKPDDLQLYSKLLGTVWIDEQDKQVARLEAKLSDNFKVGGGALVKIKKGGYLIAEQTRYDDEVWLPSFSDVNISLRLFLVKGININQMSRYSNYLKFTTEVKSAEVGKP